MAKNTNAKRKAAVNVALREGTAESAARLLCLGKGAKASLQEASLPALARELVEHAIAEGIFRGGRSELFHVVLPRRSGPRMLVLAGVGEEGKLDAEGLRRAIGSVARVISAKQSPELILDLGRAPLEGWMEKIGWEAATRAIVEGWSFGGYSFDGYKTAEAADKRRPLRLVLSLDSLPAATRASVRAGFTVAREIAAGVKLARDLANEPANELYPETLAAHARELARSEGLRCRVLGAPEIERERMGGLLAVSRGSARPPRFIVVEHSSRAPGRPTVVLIGKAVTFDSGGISIKPALGMEEMKFDMAGGAAVLGTLLAVARLRSPVHVVGLIPSTENMINGSAMRPGDVIKTADGKTVEVVNTDAEGRLILADALHYARRFRPAAVVDVATLTGAIVIALGTKISGLMTNSTELGKRLADAARACGEAVWEMPLLEDAFEAIKSKVADLKNSAGREAGALTAAAFLASFATELTWAHLDIAGTGWTTRAHGYQPVGATGVGVRILAELVAGFAQPARPRRPARSAAR